MNIIELIESQLDDRFTQAAASETGLSADETRTTTRAAIPALLASLLSAISKPAGSKALGSVLKDPSLLGNLSSMLTGSGTRSAAGTGIRALTSLLGEGKLSSLANAIGGFSGIGANQSRSLIGMLFPLVMGVLGREQRGGGGTPSVDGIARLLSSQKHEIANAMPAGLASSLRSTGILDALEDEPTRRTAGTASTASTPRYETTTQRPAQRNRSWFWPVAAGVAALALVVWGLTRLGDDDEDTRIAADRDADTTDLAAAPPNVDLSVGGVDLRQELTSVVDRATQSLRGVTDATSAEAALPTLSELNDDLDNMTPMVDRLPEPARNAFADFARTSHGRLSGEIDRIESIPGVPENVKQVVREIGSKVEGFFTRGRG